MGPWLSPRDAADYLGILSEDLPSLVRRGLLPAPSQHLGPRRPRYPQAELDRFMAGLGADAKRGTTMLASTGHVLTTATGRPWVREYLSGAIKEAAQAAGMRPGLNLHGLRKLRAASLAESGASTKEIAAVTGHKTLSMVAHYAASADQEKLASAAIIRLNTKHRKKKA